MIYLFCDRLLLAVLAVWRSSRRSPVGTAPREILPWVPVETADGTDQRVNVEQVEKIIVQAKKIAAAGSVLSAADAAKAFKQAM